MTAENPLEPSSTPSIDAAADLAPFVKAILGKKALDVVVLDMRDLTSVADFFIICSGRSNRQVSALAQHVQTDLKKIKCYPLQVEGLQQGHWVLLDYGHVVIHVFYETIRSLYDLEGLWVDAERVDISPWQ